MLDEAVVICTRNRPDDLRTLLANLRSQSGMDHRLTLIVDASDPERKEEVQRTLPEAEDLAVRRLDYDGDASLARQRNFGVASLPVEIQIVHFLDDDVVLEPDCLNRLADALDDPDVGGVGGRVINEGAGLTRKSTFWRRFFLLDTQRPGAVLPSGASTLAQGIPAEEAFATEWLGGCASYRRSLVEELKFDDHLEGYSLDEDVDFSYRVSRRHSLMVIPEAVIHHRMSTSGRSNPREYAHDFLVHRYWFLEKNVRHPLRKPAFWWAACGRLIATQLSSSPFKSDAAAGLWDGVGTIWRRDHPLLRNPL